MSQPVCSLSFTVEAVVRTYVIAHKIFGGQSGTRTKFSLSTSVLSCHYHSTNVPYSPSSTHSSYQKDRREKSGDIPGSKDLSEIGQHWIEKHFRPCQASSDKVTI